MKMRRLNAIMEILEIARIASLFGKQVVIEAREKSAGRDVAGWECRRCMGDARERNR